MRPFSMRPFWRIELAFFCPWLPGESSQRQLSKKLISVVSYFILKLLRVIKLGTPDRVGNHCKATELARVLGYETH